MSVLKASFRQRLDAAGEFSAEFPLTDPQTEELQPGRVYQHFEEGRGFAFAGSIEQRVKTPVESLSVSGDSLLVELLHSNTLIGKEYSDTSVDDIIDDLLAGTGWERAGSVSDLITVRFDGESILRALLAVTEQAGVHVREAVTSASGVLVRRLEIGALGEASGVVCSNGAADDLGLADYGLAVIPEGQFSVEDATTEVWNWVLPLGAGEGAAQLTLVQQTRLPNLIDTNPSFEADLEDWTVNEAGGTIDAIDTYSVHGDRGVYVDGSGATNTRLDRAIPVNPGQYYRGEVWAWVLTDHLTLALEWHDAAHATLQTDTVDTTGSGQWERLDSEAIAAPAGATHVHYFLHTESVGEGYFDLARFWRTASDAGLPYDILTALTAVADAHALINWYISDAASVTAYGTRQRPFVAKDIVPLSYTKPAYQVAANALYDLAAAQLTRWKDMQAVYSLSVVGLDPNVAPGDTVRLRYKGMATRAGEDFMYVDVDEEVYLLERETVWEDIRTDNLMVSNLDRQVQNDDEVVIGKLEDTIRAFRTHVQTSVGVWAEQVGPEEVDATHDLTFNARVPDNVVQLLRCLITITPRAIRSPVAVSEDESDHTHDVNLGSTQGGSTPAATTPAGTLAAGGGVTSAATGTPSGGGATSGTNQHEHEHGSVGGSASAPATWKTVAFWDGGGFHSVIVGVSDSGTPVLSTRVETPHQHTTPNHTHPDHTHSIPSHTHPDHTHPVHSHPSHSHSISGATSERGSAHAHGLTFGIFEGTSAAGITITVDGVARTAQLGGPWSAQATIDITRFLLDGDSMVVRGDHDIVLTSVQLGRIEARLEWAVAVAALAQ